MAIPSQYPIYIKKYIISTCEEGFDSGNQGTCSQPLPSTRSQPPWCNLKISFLLRDGWMGWAEKSVDLVLKKTPLCAHMLPQYAVGLISGQRTILKTESKVFLCQPAYLDSSSLPPAASPRTQLPFKTRSNFYRWQRHNMLMIETLRWPLIAAWWSGCSE